MGNLFVNQTANILGNLEVTQNASILGNVSLNQNATISGNLNVNNNTIINLFRPRIWIKILRDALTLERMHQSFKSKLMEYGMMTATKTIPKTV
jgi:predicted acyltransferase (DUF342 family)